MAEQPPAKLGKYSLEARIAVGGMAEVFLARDGAGKQCVIKRMLPTLLVDKHFAQMFLDEARLVVQLNHPSIAQIYDFGQDHGVLYLAMEWVQGTNLRAIVKDFAKRGGEIPVEYCARLIAQVALALGYAHRAAGIDGKRLKIIHRDVSPQNILLGNTGVVKLIDFGVAKATSASQRTAAGVIKGKFAYMSPEQLRGDPLDGRSDIFGLGLVLYELLAAERAVPGLTEADIAQNALRMAFLPIEHKRPDVPAPLRAILARALAKDREDRYDTAEQLAAELEMFITPRMPKLTPADVAKILPPPDVVAAGIPHESGREHSPVAFRGGATNAPTQLEVTRNNAAPRQVTTIKIEGTPARPAFNADPPTENSVTVSNAENTIPEDLVAPPRRVAWFIGAALAGFALAALGWKIGRGSNPDSEDVAAHAPAAVEQADPSEPVAPAPAERPAPEPSGNPVAAPLGRLTVTASIPSRISIDGKVAGKTPLELALAPGAHQLEFEDLGSTAHTTRKIELKQGQSRAEQWSPENGRVMIRAVPWAEVFLGGKSLGVTPLEPITLLSGTHAFTFVNSQTQRQDEQLVEVKARRDTVVKVDLQPTK